MSRPDPRLSHRARQRLKAQVRAEEPTCHLCDIAIDLDLDRYRHPLASVIDEVVPRRHGGSPLDRANTRHAHRLCNGMRGTKPVTPELRRACRAAVLTLLGAPRADTSRRY